MDDSKNKQGARIHARVEDVEAAIMKLVTCDAHTRVHKATLGAVERQVGRNAIAPVNDQAMDEAGPGRGTVDGLG